MSSAHQNLSAYSPEDVPSASPYRFAIVTAEWNKEVTAALSTGAFETLTHFGATNILQVSVPGTFELTAAATMLATTKKYDVIICLGCVVQGETRHFDFICQGVANGLSTVAINFNLPVIFGVLTTDSMTQALERAGGKHGNKGIEAAITAIKMAALQLQLRS